jgi:hypothetical protein
MKTKIKYLLLLSSLSTTLSFADNIIYKCTSSTGEITYQNSNSSNCNKTDLANFDTFNSYKTIKSVNTSPVLNKSTSSNTDMKITEDQKSRDDKRGIILNKELDLEKEQLNTVTNMLQNLKNISSTDTSQINQLNELRTTHENNIIALSRELGIKNSSKESAKDSVLKIEKAIEKK